MSAKKPSRPGDERDAGVRAGDTGSGGDEP